VGVTHKLRLAVLGLFIALLLTHLVRGADSGIDYLEPKILTGTIYADAGLKQELFTFRRMATNSGSSIHVLREFNLPDGTLAARERVVYEGGQLKSFELEELQTGAKGSAMVQADAGGAKINFNYSQGATKKTGSEKFLNEILVSDMVGPYIIAHWDALTKGLVVKCRLVSVSRAETVGFKFFKESDSTWHGKPVMIWSGCNRRASSSRDWLSRCISFLRRKGGIGCCSTPDARRRAFAGMGNGKTWMR
jgi:hypothetical protein